MIFEGLGEAARYAERVQGWRQAQYDADGIPTDPHHWLAQVACDLDGRAYETGIRSDRKRRGASVNVCATARDDERRLALLQVRESIFRPSRYTRVRKSYFLVGRNENGSAFAHPVDCTSRARVPQVLARLWGVSARELPDVEARRQGDVALVPVRALPDLPEVEGSITVAGSHVVSGTLRIDWRDYREPIVYVRRDGSVVHSKGQHPTVRVRGGWYRVAVAPRAAHWGFASPTAD